MRAGIDLARGGLAFGAVEEPPVSGLESETGFMDRNGKCRAHEPEPHQPDATLVALVAQIGPAANAEVRSAGVNRYLTAAPALRVEPPTFAVASADDLGGPATTFTSYSQAWQAMKRDGAPRLQVVAAFEREPVA